MRKRRRENRLAIRLLLLVALHQIAIAGCRYQLYRGSENKGQLAIPPDAVRGRGARICPHAGLGLCRSGMAEVRGRVTGGVCAISRCGLPCLLPPTLLVQVTVCRNATPISPHLMRSVICGIGGCDCLTVASSLS